MRRAPHLEAAGPPRGERSTLSPPALRCGGSDGQREAGPHCASTLQVSVRTLHVT
ncbi:hypothetical protein T484DRAFT_2802809 [Baffinella frigidus]|nr:hypothetical protein T484DRAFT_2802809 [Cryptophyta sp. CCMP2293]